MKTSILIIAVFMLTVANIKGQENLPQTVQSLDIKKYVGLWYEVAKIPNWFQKQCVKGTNSPI